MQPKAYEKLLQKKLGSCKHRREGNQPEMRWGETCVSIVGLGPYTHNHVEATEEKKFQKKKRISVHLLRLCCWCVLPAAASGLEVIASLLRLLTLRVLMIGHSY